MLPIQLMTKISIYQPGGTELISPQPPDIFQQTNINVLTLLSITNKGPQIAWFPTLYNGIKVYISINLHKIWQWDYKLMKLLPAGSYFPLVHGQTTTNYKHKNIYWTHSLCCGFQPDNMPDMGNYVITKISNDLTIKACWNILYSFSIQRRHTILDKKREKQTERPRHLDSETLLIPRRSTNHRIYQDKHQILKTCHHFLSLPWWLNHAPTVYMDIRNFQRADKVNHRQKLVFFF